MTKIRISPRIAVLSRALASQMGRVYVYSDQPAEATAAKRMADIGQLDRTSVGSAPRGSIETIYTLADTVDQVLCREHTGLHADLQVAYRLLARALQKNQPKAETTHRRTIARLHAEQEALEKAKKARE